MFDNTIRDTRPLAFMKKTFQVAVGAYLVIGLIAGYRAWYQVHSLDLRRSGTQLDSRSSRNTPLLRTELEILCRDL